MSVRPAVFFDRDGILNELVTDNVTGHPESPLHEGDVRLMPGVAGMVHRLQEAGFRRRNFEAPNGWLLNRSAQFPTSNFHFVPADGDWTI